MFSTHGTTILHPIRRLGWWLLLLVYFLVILGITLSFVVPTQ